jgi:hypothetical protein
MEALLAKLFYPLVLAFGIWCGKEDGVEVQFEIRGAPQKTKMNVVCEKPDLRMPVFGRKDERKN